jgi:O-antigen/teichoic acid export membrane protein
VFVRSKRPRNKTKRLAAVLMKIAIFAEKTLDNAASFRNAVVAPASRRLTYFGEIGWVLIAQGAVFLGGLATVKVAATVLGPAEYGKLSVALAAIGIAQVCFYGAISQTAMRFLAFASVHNLSKEYKLTLVKLAGAAALLIVLAWGVAAVFGLQRLVPVPGAILVAYAIISGALMVAIAVCNAARKRDVVGIAQATEAITRPLLIIAVTYLTISTATHTLVAYLISSGLVGLVIVALWAVKEGKSENSESDRPDGESVKAAHLPWAMTIYAAPFVIFTVVGMLGSHGERLLLAKWATWSEVGSYALMSQLVMAPNVLFTAVINQFYFPLVFQLDPGGTRTMTRGFGLYLLISILGVTAITTVVALSAPLLIPLLSTHAFLGHQHLMWFLGPSAGLFCIAQQLALQGMRLHRPAIYMPAKLAHSLALLGPSLILVPIWGVDGMGVASLTASATYLSAMLLANAWLQRNLKLVGSAEVER